MADLDVSLFSGLPTTIFIVFLILKLTHNITWSWWWVSAPLWIPVVFLLLILLIGGLIIVWGKHTGRW
jgi:hypothetical protein